MDGLRIYFDFTLASLLLYNFERDQYEQVMGTPLVATEGSSENDMNVKEQSDGRSMADVKVEKNTENTLNETKQVRNDATKRRKPASIPENTEEQVNQGKLKSMFQQIRVKFPDA